MQSADQSPFRISLAIFAVAAILLASDASLAAESRLSCFVRGFPQPIHPTDEIAFDAADAGATVGISRNLGGVGVQFTITEPKSGQSLQLIDARSAGGAGWQTSVGVGDSERHRIIHYNQAAGNSAHNWGYESAYTIDAQNGIKQLDWLPLESNDFLDGDGFDAKKVLTSPCVGNAEKFGDGRLLIEPQHIAVGDGNILRLTNAYSIRSSADQHWKWIQVDQAVYLNIAAAYRGGLQFFVAQAGRPLIGPISPVAGLPVIPKAGIRNLSGTDSDWFFSTYPMTYALITVKLGGNVLGIAIHPPDGKSFTGFLRYRGHLFCKEDKDECGNIQWHSSVAMSRFDPFQSTKFHEGEISTYTVQYDIGSLAHLAKLGFLSK